MFSIRVICLVSFHYLRRRRLRRFYANRGERRSFASSLPSLHSPPPSIPLGSDFPEHVSYCFCTFFMPFPLLLSFLLAYFFLFSFLFLLPLLSPRLFSPSFSSPSPPLGVAVAIIITIVTKIRIIIFPSRFGTRRINIIHNSFHFFGVH